MITNTYVNSGSDNYHAHERQLSGLHVSCILTFFHFYLCEVIWKIHRAIDLKEITLSN